MAANSQPSGGGNRAPVPILPQGLIEKAFPAHGPCTERVRFSKLERDSGDRFYLERGIITGELAEHEVVSWAKGHGFTVGLGAVVEQIIKGRRCPRLSPEQLHDIRRTALGWVRDYQDRFSADDGLPWTGMEYLADPQTDFILWRPDEFGIRVRPDVVVGVGDALVGLEFSTARDTSTVSPARIALNWHALTRARMRNPEWNRYGVILTRVEWLALGYGTTERLSLEEAEAWRAKIAGVADDIIAERYTPKRGPWCSTCRYQAACWASTDQMTGTEF